MPTWLFFTRPILSFIFSTMLGLPFGENIALADFNIGILYIFAVSSLGVWDNNQRVE
jgi:NADH-quinone oxidoreductase subunit H